VLGRVKPRESMMPKQPAQPNRANNDPDRPAYDNPARNKGDLATGDNVREKRRPVSNAPQGHDSDRMLRQDPDAMLPRHR